MNDADPFLNVLFVLFYFGLLAFGAWIVMKIALDDIPDDPTPLQRIRHRVHKSL